MSERNRLGDQSSAYLRAHADDPVKWRPWGSRTLKEARTLNRPLFISIGYASCHWCHVMQRESFRDNDTAKVINSLTVPVKVDREIRPDVDALFMAYVQASTGSGGWPMSVFATSEGVPFLGGTYFPARSSHPQMPAFRDVLETVRHSWVLSRDETLEAAQEARDFLDTQASAARAIIDRDTLDSAARALLDTEDREYGGFGGAPKFPQSPLVSFLAAYARLTGEQQPAQAALRGALAMLRGGTYDQAGGGVFRYSVDAQWLVPHFEKMLYDQAGLLSSVAALAPYANDDEFAELAHYARATARFLMRDLARPDGGYFSALDAETAGVEGATYVWTHDELAEVLDESDLALAEEFLGVTENGNWERNTTILTRRAGRGAEGERAEIVDAALERVFEARVLRTQPALVDNVIVSWNAMAARGLIEAGTAFSDASLVKAGVSCVQWLLDEAVWRSEVLHAIGDKSVANIRFLEDSAAVVSALLTAAETGAWSGGLKTAAKLHAAALDRFSADDGFVMSVGDDALPWPVYAHDDSPSPSGPSLLAENAIRLQSVGASLSKRTLGLDARDVALSALAQLGRTAAIVPALAGHALSVRADMLCESP